MQLDTFAFSSTGGRDYNEDAVGQRELPDGGVLVLADGLGGTVHGEKAAACVVEQFTTAALPPDDSDGCAWLIEQMDAAQSRILALQEQTHTNMKSTAVALLLRGDSAAWAHVGDSRLYYFHARELAAVTEDHSVAYKKFKSGQITRAEIAQDDDQSALLRALGNPERYRPDLRTQAGLCPGDAFLLCSDGVWEYLHDGEILVDLLKSKTARDWALLLLTRVLSRVQGGNDNLSLLTVLVKEGSELR